MSLKPLRRVQLASTYFRSQALIKAILPFIEDRSSKVLDIGAGWCHMPKTMSEKHGFDVTAIDVVDHNVTDFPLTLYDGKKLPYPSSSFDVGLLVFVLHHASDVGGLLKEAGRVCKYLIVVEDMPGNRLEKLIWKRLDYSLNHALFKDIEVAHEAKSTDEWKAYFKSHGYKVIKTKKFRSLFTTTLTYPHQVFVLKPK